MSNEEYYKFNCGCKIPIINGHPQIVYKKLNLNCPKTWKIYQDGQTRSIFQLESFLGKKWSKELKPKSIIDASALISVIRPGVLQIKNENNESLTKVFCNRKNSDWEASDNIIDTLLEDTCGVWVFQEQVMSVTKKLANFDGTLQMKLIKAISKKDNALLNSLRQNFVKGCIENNSVSEDEANEIFSDIEKSGRYLFNKSHAVGYSETGYWTAWVKAHLPKHYICAWLRNASNEAKPREEIRAVISEATRLKIKVLPPSLKNLPYTNFFIRNNAVYFGLDSIKSCGEKAIDGLKEKIKDVTDNWLEFLLIYSKALNKTQIINMIRTGCLDYMGHSRLDLENQYNQYSLLKDSEKKVLIQSFEELLFTDLVEALTFILPKVKEVRKTTVQEIIKSCKSKKEDHKSNIILHEKELLGINVSCSNTERASIPDSIHSCKEAEAGLPDRQFIIVGEILDYREIKIKTGKNIGDLMATFSLADETGQCECVIFSDKLDYYQGSVYDGNIVMIKGKKSKRGSLSVDKIYEV